MGKSGQPTMKDVARKAGVSLGTVSKVINGIPVGESYRRSVQAAIDALGYQINDYARGLKTNKTNCIGLVMPSLKHPFFAALTDEITACLMRSGYRSLLMITNYDPEAERKCFQLVRQNKADGVIALTYSPIPDMDDSLPVVTIDRHLGPDVPCVSSDNFRGGELAADKLFELGARKLLFLRIGPGVPGEADKRGAGFETRCRALGVEPVSVRLHDEETEVLFFRFLDDHTRDGVLDFDGIFCNTDSLAVHVMEHLRSRGVDIPGQVQIIGYDGIRDYATGRCGCSTIEQPVGKMAEAAVRILLSGKKQDPYGGVGVNLPVRYVPGGTTRDGSPASPKSEY